MLVYLFIETQNVNLSKWIDYTNSPSKDLLSQETHSTQVQHNGKYNWLQTNKASDTAFVNVVLLHVLM